MQPMVVVAVSWYAVQVAEYSPSSQAPIKRNQEMQKEPYKASAQKWLNLSLNPELPKELN